MNLFEKAFTTNIILFVTTIMYEFSFISLLYSRIIVILIICNFLFKYSVASVVEDENLSAVGVLIRSIFDITVLFNYLNILFEFTTTLLSSRKRGVKRRGAKSRPH